MFSVRENRSAKLNPSILAGTVNHMTKNFFEFNIIKKSTSQVLKF
uniref:Uncharacterized protein n=1 Tax=Arundo donax TaxID=35708 RepID=A0A0A9HVD1_ARUDO